LLLARVGMNRIRHIAIPELGGNRIAIDQHRQVVKAIVAGNGAKAREHMLAHIRSPLDFVDAICARYPEYFSAD
jgi:DNA-binding GntR family transcriptional regulator